MVSDYGGVEMLASAHRLTDDRRVAAKLAAEAGVDVELPRRDVYGDGLGDAMAAGIVSTALIDQMVERVMRLKFELGLFEDPYVEVPDDSAIETLVAQERAVGHELALRSLVLLANEGVLPLSAEARRVAVIGEAATNPRDFVGDYSHLVHLETLGEARRTGSTAFGIINSARVVAAEDELAGRATLLEELRRRLVGNPGDLRSGSRRPFRVRRGDCPRSELGERQ